LSVKATGDSRGRDGGIAKSWRAAMKKQRRVYQPRFFDGRIIMPDEIERGPPRQPVPVACDEERSLPDAQRDVTGRAEGE
jgi:hypothetical protein